MHFSTATSPTVGPKVAKSSLWSRICLAPISESNKYLPISESNQLFLQPLVVSRKMSTTLPLFWHLSSGSKNERIDASVKLLSALEHFQSQFVQKATHMPTADTSEDEEEEEDNTTKSKDGLDLWNTQDVSYSIRRLIRGLASPRESSRLGFAVALTEVCPRTFTVMNLGC